MPGTLEPNEEKFVKLLILTGKRRNAVQGMRWEQLDGDWYWTPPKGFAE